MSFEANMVLLQPRNLPSGVFTTVFPINCHTLNSLGDSPMAMETEPKPHDGWEACLYIPRNCITWDFWAGFLWISTLLCMKSY